MARQDVSSTNLDLSDVPNDQVGQLASSIERFYKGDSATKAYLSWSWERNHLFLDGHQWIVYDGNRDTGGLWRKLGLSKANEYIPRPVTNYVFDVYQTLKSYLIKNKPRSSVYPNTQTFQDKTAAKIGTLILECNWERLSEQQNYEYAAAALVTYGTVFKKSFWDTSYASSIRVPKTEQRPKLDPATGLLQTDELGNPVLDEVPVLDEFGSPVVEEIPLGDVSTQVIEPYRMALDPMAMNLHEARWIMEYSIMTLPAIKEIYGKTGDGYTGLADTVKEESALSSSMRKYYQLKTSSGVRTSFFMTGDGTAGSEQMLPNAAVVKEYYERPSSQFQKGRLIVVANGVTLYAGEPLNAGPDQGDWHPYSECRWELVPGRFWGKSPIDDIIEIQKQVNSIDSVIVLTRKTMAIPQKLIPLGVGVASGSWTGRPGQEVFYRDTGGNKPENLNGAGVDPSVFQERAQRVEDIKNLSGAIDILKGDRPPGVTAASALNLLYEVGTGKLYPILDRWKRFVENDQKKQLKLVSKFYKEPRPEFIKSLKMRNSELSEAAISSFIGQDLYDNCNVVVEAGSNVPKLQAAKQAMLLEVANTGALNLDLPANRLEFQRQLGIQGFDNDVGPDSKRAEWENDLIDNINNSPDNRPIVLDVDNHDIHIEVHSKRMKEPSFMALSLDVQQEYMMHIQQHEQMKAQKEQMAQIQAMAAGVPPMPLEDQGALNPEPASSYGKGVSQKLKDSIMGDATIPGGQGT